MKAALPRRPFAGDLADARALSGFDLDSGGLPALIGLYLHRVVGRSARRSKAASEQGEQEHRQSKEKGNPFHDSIPSGMGWDE